MGKNGVMAGILEYSKKNPGISDGWISRSRVLDELSTWGCRDDADC